MRQPMWQRCIVSAFTLFIPILSHAICTNPNSSGGITCIDPNDNIMLNYYEAIPASLDHANFIFSGTTVTSTNGQSMFGRTFTGTTGNSIQFNAMNAVFNGNGHFINVYQSDHSTYDFNHVTFNFHATSGFVFNFYAGPSANNTSLSFTDSTLNFNGSTYGMAVLTGENNTVNLTNTNVDITGGAVGLSLQGKNAHLVLNHSSIIGSSSSAISSNTYGFNQFDINHSTLSGDNDSGTISYDSLINAVDQATNLVSTININNSTIQSSLASALHLEAPNNLIDQNGKSTHIYNVLIDHSTLTGAKDTISDQGHANLANQQFNITLNQSVINAPAGENAIVLISSANVINNNSTINGNTKLLGNTTNFVMSGGQMIGSFEMGSGTNNATFIHSDTSKITQFNGGIGNSTLNFINTTHTGGADIVNWNILNLKDHAALTLNSNLLMKNGGQIDLSNNAVIYAGNNVHPIIAALQPNQTITVKNAGVIDLTNTNQYATPGTNSLTIRGHYIGEGGVLVLNNVTTSKDTYTDKLIIDGKNGGGSATGLTYISIRHLGIKGGLTRGNGIPVVLAINNATTSAGAFTFQRGFRAGAYDYRLLRGGLNAADSRLSQNWYLRSTYSSPIAKSASVRVTVPAEPDIQETDPTFPPSPQPNTQTALATPAPQALPPRTPFPSALQPIIGPELSVYGSAIPTIVNMNIASIGTLHQRVGEEHDAIPLLSSFGQFANGVWVRAFGESYSDQYSSIADPETSGSIAGVQIGIDLYRAKLASGTQNNVGIYVAYAHDTVNVDGLITNHSTNNNTYQNTGNITLNGTTGGLYWTHFWPQGSYTDLVIQSTAYQGNANSTRAGISLSGSSITASAESGYAFHYNNVWLLQPEVQLITQHAQLKKTEDDFSAIDPGSTNVINGRLGGRAQYATQLANWLVQPYGIINFWSTLTGGRSTTVYANVDNISTNSSPAFAQLGAGLTAFYNHNVSIYGQVNGLAGLSHSHQKHTAVTGMVGVRINL